MQNTLRIAAMLLGYPSQELQEEARALAFALRGEAALSSPRRAAMERLLLRLGAGDLLDLQAEYSEHFDRSRSLSLHLFEHVHGDNRERGQAMIDLGSQYLAAGFYLDSGELPDFIPVFLEFASCLPPHEAREWLAQPGHVFAALSERLEKRASPYAAIFAALVELGGRRLDRNALEELQRNAPDDDPGRLDEEWEEAPVTFGGAHEMGGPNGVTAKIRAANRPVGREQA